MERNEILRELLDWHRQEVTVAQNKGAVVAANATLEAALRVMMGEREGTTHRL